MFEAQVSYYLNQYLGHYLHGLDRQALKISVWRGDVQLKNLQLKPEALQDLNLPITVKAGLLGKLTLKVRRPSIAGCAASTCPCFPPCDNTLPGCNAVHIHRRGLLYLVYLIHASIHFTCRRVLLNAWCLCVKHQTLDNHTTTVALIDTRSMLGIVTFLAACNCNSNRQVQQ